MHTYRHISGLLKHTLILLLQYDSICGFIVMEGKGWAVCLEQTVRYWNSSRSNEAGAVKISLPKLSFPADSAQTGDTVLCKNIRFKFKMKVNHSAGNCFFLSVFYKGSVKFRMCKQIRSADYLFSILQMTRKCSLAMPLSVSDHLLYLHAHLTVVWLKNSLMCMAKKLTHSEVLKCGASHNPMWYVPT